MGGKLKTVGIIFLICLALGAGWALWLGLKLVAYIAIGGLAIGLLAGVALKVRSGPKIAGPDERSRLTPPR